MFFLPRAIGCIKSSIFYPVVTFLLLAICTSYWAVTAVYPLSCVVWSATVFHGPGGLGVLLHPGISAVLC